MQLAHGAAGASALAASTFLLIFVNEIADKSRVVALLLIGTYRTRWPVFWGMTLAYAVTDLAAVLAGGWLHASLPERLVWMGSGLLFLGFGAAALFFADEAEEGAKGLLAKAQGWGPFVVSFAATAAAEMGDRTQLASAALAAESGRAWPVYLGAMAALALLNLLTVLAGEKLAARLSPTVLHKAGGGLFIGGGLWLLWRGFALA